MLKSTNLDEKLDYAVKLYDKKQYYKALPLFEELITLYRGTKKAEKTYYYFAYTNYKLEDYASAAFDFENFAKTFPSSEWAEECSFMSAYCYYQDSPEYSLDQTNTLKAISQMQLFADHYPASKRIAECNELIDQLRWKLELKSYDIAKLYFSMEEYKAAVTSYKNLVKDFPSTKFREEALFMILKAGFRLADNSIDSKKAERFQQAQLSYAEFVNAYPQSKYKKDADDINEAIKKRQDKKDTASTPKL